MPAVLWALFILFLSSIPAGFFTGTGFQTFDKPVHALFFFILAGLSRRALIHQDRYPRLRDRSVLYAFAFAVAYGVYDEIYQMFIPGRETDVLDILADAVGSLLFVMTAGMVSWWQSGKKRANGPSRPRNPVNAQ